MDGKKKSNKVSSWIKSHPIWSVIIGIVFLIFLITIFSGGNNNSNANIQSENLTFEKQVFYQLVELQDTFPSTDFNWTEEMDYSKVIIANKFNISLAEINQIEYKGAKNQWPMPPIK